MRIAAIDAGADPQPGGVLVGVEVVDDLEVLVDAVVDRGRIGQVPEGQLGIVSQALQQIGSSGAIDLHLD